MKVCVYSANLGNFDSPKPNAEQTVGHEFCLFTDENFRPRTKSMTPRLQARIVKMFGWQLVPDYDVYIWHDASTRLSRPDTVQWLLDKVQEHDIAVFKHPNRNTVLEEADYLKHRLIIEKHEPKRRYVLSRYEGEDIDGALSEVDPNRELFASTVFVYRNFPNVQKALKEWFYYTSRYHSIDQLGLPEAIKDLRVNVIPDKYMECQYLEHTR
jgi:hypothetical protein